MTQLIEWPQEEEGDAPVEAERIKNAAPDNFTEFLEKVGVPFRQLLSEEHDYDRLMGRLKRLAGEVQPRRADPPLYEEAERILAELWDIRRQLVYILTRTSECLEALGAEVSSVEATKIAANLEVS